MDANQLKKKSERDQRYWDSKLESKKKYAESEKKWRDDLLKLNPEHP